jgi:hypothetical protein
MKLDPANVAGNSQARPALLVAFILTGCAKHFVAFPAGALEALESAYMYPLISFSPSALTRPKIGQSADLGGGNPTLDRVSVLYFPFRVLTSSETIRCFPSERVHQMSWKSHLKVG